MYTNNKIIILGMARSGIAAARLLIKRNNEVIINDIKDDSHHNKEDIKELRNLGVKLILGSHPDDLIDNSVDYLIKNPGVPIDHKYVLKCNELDIEVINEVELAYNLLPKSVNIIAITGTNGKTTTTTLTYNIMHEYFKSRVHLAGNIGYPLTSIIDKVKENDFIVTEISVQQSVNIKNFHPNVGLITNYNKAHIDFLKTYENYKKTKAKMFFNQESNNIAILNYKDKEVLEELKNIKSKVKYFNDNKTYFDDKYIFYNNEIVMNISDVKIPGNHNLENILSAISIVKEYNVDNKTIEKVISNFYGVEHRLEYVTTINNVRYYNDTEATNIKCTQIALSSFLNPTIIILGGLERGQDFNELKDYINNVKVIIAIGECRKRVVEFAKLNKKEVYEYEFLKDSINKIKEISIQGDVVLLSPASASWDQYKECEERGLEFKNLVKGE